MDGHDEELYDRIVERGGSLRRRRRTIRAAGMIGGVAATTLVVALLVSVRSETGLETVGPASPTAEGSSGPEQPTDTVTSTFAPVQGPIGGTPETAVPDGGEPTVPTTDGSEPSGDGPCPEFGPIDQDRLLAEYERQGDLDGPFAEQFVEQADFMANDVPGLIADGICVTAVGVNADGTIEVGVVDPAAGNAVERIPPLFEHPDRVRVVRTPIGTALN